MVAAAAGIVLTTSIHAAVANLGGEEAVAMAVGEAVAEAAAVQAMGAIRTRASIRPRLREEAAEGDEEGQEEAPDTSRRSHRILEAVATRLAAAPRSSSARRSDQLLRDFTRTTIPTARVPHPHDLASRPSAAAAVAANLSVILPRIS